MFALLFCSQKEMMSMQGLRHLEARLYIGMDIVYLAFLQCRGPLVCLFLLEMKIGKGES